MGQPGQESPDKTDSGGEDRKIGTGQLGNGSQTGRLYDRSKISFHSREAYFEVVIVDYFLRIDKGGHRHPS